MRRLLMAALAMGALLLVALAAGACDDDGDGVVSLDEYFRQIDELDNELATSSDALEGQFDALDTASVDEARDLFDQQIDLLDGFLDDLDAIDPPEEAANAHDEALSAGRELATALRSAIDRAADAASIEEFFSLFDDPELDAADTRLTEACLDLEQIAADNAITVDLDCEDEEGDGTDGGDETPVDGDGTDGGDETPVDGDGTDGGDTSELEDYYEQLDELENAYREAGNEADAAFAALAASAPVSDAIAILDDVVATLDEFVAGLEDLDPPDEVAEAHAETVAGFTFVSEFFQDVIDNADDYPTQAEFAAVLNDADLMEASVSLDGACTGLQSIADANAIAVDLNCENE